MENKNQFLIREITSDDLDEVAEIHRLAFPESILSVFGCKVIRRYYEWQMTEPNECYAIGAFQNGFLVGFNFAGVFIDSEIGFIKKNWRLLLSIVTSNPKILENPTIKTKAKVVLNELINENKNMKNRSKKDTQYVKKFGILSIAVHPDFQKKGVGKILLCESEKFALLNQYTEIRLSVHPSNKKAITVYEQEGWIKHLNRDEVWSGAMRKVLIENSENLTKIGH